MAFWSGPRVAAGFAGIETSRHEGEPPTLRSAMAKAEASVEELVGMIERGELRLPEMQRRYVWRSTRVRDLLDSLYRGYPSGAILLWETDEAVPLQDFAVAQQRNPYQSTRLLLDGQQRLTSLSAVIRGEPVNVRGRKRPIELLFNLDHPDQLAVVTEVNEDGDDDDDDEDLIDDEADSTEDELQRRFDRMTFVVATRKLEQLPHWVKVSDVFKTDEDAPVPEAGRHRADLDDPRYEKYSQRLARLRGIRKYVYRMDVLERSLSYDEVTEIFVRVNSLGAKLRSSDLALAQITAKWRSCAEDLPGVPGAVRQGGLRPRSRHPPEEHGRLRHGPVALPDCRQPVRSRRCRRPGRSAAAGWSSRSTFSRATRASTAQRSCRRRSCWSPSRYFGHKRDYEIAPDEAERLRYWVLVANAKGRYSRGSSETLLDQDLATLREGGGAHELIDRLRLQVGRLDITPEELEGRNQRSALFKTMFLAFRAAGAKDWRSNLAIALDHSGAQHRLQFHHVFPKAVLKSSYTARGGRRHRQPRLHRRQDQPADQRQAAGRLSAAIG